MEQCFRIAFCMMFLLTGYLQAQPVRECKTIHTNDLDLEDLKEHSCNGMMNFTSPSMGIKTKECYVAALRLFIKGMQEANCTREDTNYYINNTKDALEQQPCLNMETTECNFSMNVHENFGQFVRKIEDFVHEWNSFHSQKP